MPDAIARDLARRIGADEGAGVATPLSDGRLTGTVSGGLALRDGKVAWVARKLAAHGLTWADVAAVGDDRNNLPLLRRVARSIGFRPTSNVRLEADVVVDRDDLAALIPALHPGRESAATAARRAWHGELVRKIVHLTGVALPYLFHRHPTATLLALLMSAAGYLAIEAVRLNGFSVPVAAPIGRMAIRREERRRIAAGPLTLALGIGLSFCVLPFRLAYACVLMAVVADSLAAVVGERWGRLHWPWNREKTLAGSGAFLIGAWLCALIALPWPAASWLAVIGMWLESLPVRDWDNVLTPVGTGLLMGTGGVLAGAAWLG
jgi:dolichol kinase